MGISTNSSGLRFPDVNESVASTPTHFANLAADAGARVQSMRLNGATTNVAFPGTLILGTWFTIPADATMEVDVVARVSASDATVGTLRTRLWIEDPGAATEVQPSQFGASWHQIAGRQATHRMVWDLPVSNVARGVRLSLRGETTAPAAILETAFAIVRRTTRVAVFT